MRIKPAIPDPNLRLMKDIKVGEVFRLDSLYYIKTSGEGFNHIKAVRLTTGDISSISNDVEAIVDPGAYLTVTV